MSELIDKARPQQGGSEAPRASAPAARHAIARADKSAAILFVPHARLGRADVWPEHFSTAARLGFNTVLLSSPFAAKEEASTPRGGRVVYDYGQMDPAFGGGDALAALETAASAARQAGTDIWLDLDIERIAMDAPLLAEHGDWFVHSGAGAHFRFLGDTDATVDWWDGQIAAWQAAGIAGFRCTRVAGIPPAVWSRLTGAAQARDPNVTFAAWTPGLTPDAVAGLAGAGFDFCFSSAGWWDCRAAWLNDDTRRLQAVAPIITMPAPPDAAFWPELRRLRALRIAACHAQGWMVEAGFEAGLEEEILVLNNLRNQHSLLVKAPAAMLASSPGADIALLTRTAGRETFLAAINPSLEHPAAMRADAILPRLGLTRLAALDGNAEITPAGSLFLEHGGVEFFTAENAPQVFILVAIPVAAEAARIAIEAITPQVDEGQFPVRRIAGEMVTVQADLIADGHDKLAGEVLYRAADEPHFRSTPLRLLNNDRWEASFPLEKIGRHIFLVTAWKDFYATFVDEVTKKHAAGVSISLELQEGLLLLQEAAAGKPAVATLLAQLKNADDATLRQVLLSPETIALMRRADVRKFATSSHQILVDAERKAAGFANWYEIFPRSQSGDLSRHGTFRDVITQLPRIAGMGFDVLYFPPIHPIGRTNRKGKNNTLTPAPDDPGSPYAIGAAEGGHDAIHPELGSLKDFLALRDAAAAYGIELALDFAIQCAPDHPWLKEHPEWFDWRPDGSLRYAENPPKKYEDIVNVDFYAPGAKPSLWLALRDVVQFWVNQGVKLFRVDNPHTKPLPFWEWLIADIQSRHPDTVFLAEAFTRPKVMYRLAKIGFSQSYTYFTWRHTKPELEEYLNELTTSAPKNFFRPHFFVNTPDINPHFLQTSGRGGFLIRAALAATLSGLWGVYNGFELCEAAPVPGKEEYFNSEKYEIKVWDYDRPGNITAEITKLNQIRRANTALQSHLGIEFLPANNPQVLYFRKFAPDGNMLLVAISLDPFNIQDATIELPLWRFGIPDDGALAAEDLMRDFAFTWRGKYQTVRLNPFEQPFCIWRVAPPTQDQ
jgi:starch synthase (maltosyl-transferring)